MATEPFVMEIELDCEDSFAGHDMYYPELPRHELRGGSGQTDEPVRTGRVEPVGASREG